MSLEAKSDPHREGSIVIGGSELRGASGAILLLHSRGGTATEMLGIGQEISLRGLALLAPQAAERTWFPHGVLAPIESNQVWFASASKRLMELINLCADCGVPRTRIAIVGFSQGACLALEFVARQPQRFGAVLAFTGGLLGRSKSDLHHPGSLEGTPVLLSSSDPDPNIPWSRAEESAEQLRGMHARVNLRRNVGRAHALASDDLDVAQRFLCSALQE